MHPTMAYDLAKIKIEEELQYAARERLARAASSDRPRAIDFSSLGRRLKVKLTGGGALNRPTATSNA